MTTVVTGTTETTATEKGIDQEDGEGDQRDSTQQSFDDDEDDDNSKPRRHSLRFYAIFPGLCLSILLGALETAILGTAFPSVAADLDASALYIWAVNGYYLAMAVVQPVYGQCANVFGRGAPMAASLVFFLLGSGLCGGASSISMLIAGRTMQGIGGGGITVMVYIIVADLVPLRDRQKYMSIVMAFYALGMFVGPIVGGVIVTHTSWRWIFWINMPIGGMALLLNTVFLRSLKHDRATTESTLAGLRRIDWLGNAILTASIVSILLAMTWGGTLHAWASYHVLVPLCLGLVGLTAVFGAHQRLLSRDPILPPHLYGNRTSLMGFALTLLQGIIMSWIAFMMPVYLQSLAERTALSAGVNLLALAVPFTPSGILAGLFISKTGRYKPPLVLGLALVPVAVGCFTLLNSASSTAANVGFQIIAGVGMGLALQSTLPAIQAPLAEADVALATGAWAFVRSFGLIWGAAIPAAVFNSRIDRGLAASTVHDPAVRALLASGGAYERATRQFITSYSGPLKAEIVALYTAALRETWQVLLAFAIVAIPIAVCIREVPLRKHLDTRFGLQESKDGGADREMTSKKPRAKYRAANGKAAALGEAKGVVVNRASLQHQARPSQ